MGRLLAVFNVLAGGASLVGLYITAFTTYRSGIVAAIFAVTLVFVAYVLFFPGNRIEANVSAKLKNYQSPDGIGTVSKLHDEFVVGGFDWKEIPFAHPFKEAPEVELIKLTGPSSVRHTVTEITAHKFVVVTNPNPRTSEDAKYRWIATGTLLPLAAMERKVHA